MKKIILFCLLFCFATNAYPKEKNLYEMFKHHDAIKVCLGQFRNEIKNTHVNVDKFKKIFADVLPKRINLNFDCVDKEDEADVVVMCNIKGYLFKEKVLPSFWSTAALVADVTAPKSAAKLTVDYTIINPQNGRVLSEFKSFTTDTRRPKQDMLDEKAFEHAARKNINRFIYRAFYRQKGK